MLAALAFAVAFVVASSPALHAQTYIVTLTTDPDAGVAANCPDQSQGATTGNQNCSLRDAFAAVDAAAPSGTTQPLIQISSSSPALYSAGSPATIALAQTSPISVAHNFNLTVPLNGTATQLTIAGGSSTAGILVQTGTNSYSTVAGVTFNGGTTSGSGGAFSSTAAGPAESFINDNFTSNNSSSASGGAIYNYNSNSNGATVTVSGCTFTGNHGSYGGAIYQVGGSLNIVNSVFGSVASPNNATDGGAVFVSSAALSLSNDTFVGNTATGYGGAIAKGSAGNLSIAQSTFGSAATGGGNSAPFAGAIEIATVSGATYSIASSNFLYNKGKSGTVTTGGGAIYLNGANNANATLTIVGNNFIGNSQAGAAYAYGGAISDYRGAIGNSLVLRNNLFQNNSVTTSSTGSTAYGGALYASGASNNNVPGEIFAGNTFTGNTANVTAASGAALGGAVYNSNNHATNSFVNNTFVSNSSVGGSTAAAAGIYINAGTVSFTNNIVANNTANASPDAEFISIGGAAYGCATSCNYASTASTAVNSTTTLSGLGSFGGPTVGSTLGTTQTTCALPTAGVTAMPTCSILPLPGSSALRAGVVASDAGATADQRGYARTLTVSGTQYIDVGATEASYTAALVAQPANALVASAISGTTSLGTTAAAPTVQLYESGALFAPGTGPGANGNGVMNVTAASGTLAGTTANVAIATTGLATLSGISISPAQTADTLTAGVPLDGTSTNYYTVASDPFNVVTPIAFTTAPPSDLAINTSPGTVTVKEFNTSNAAYVSGDTVTLTVTGTAATNYTHTYTATGSTGSFAFVPLALTAADTYTYTATDTAYTAQTAVATEYVATQLLGSLVVSGFPSPGHNGVANNVTVTAYDTTGALYTGFTGTVTLTSSDPLATLPAAYTYTATGAGSHTFSVTLATGGKQSIVATSAPIGGSQTAIVDDFIWLLNNTGATLKLAETSTEQAATSTSNTAGTYGGVAFDSSGNAWSVTSGTNSLLETTKADASPTAFSGSGGLSAPVSVAVDGAGMVWVANSGNNSVSEFTNAGVAQSGSSGYGSATLNAPSQINIDKTGGVWVTNRTGNSITHIFGAAAPIANVTASSTANGATGQKP